MSCGSVRSKENYTHRRYKVVDEMGNKREVKK